LLDNILNFPLTSSFLGHFLLLFLQGYGNLQSRNVNKSSGMNSAGNMNM